jgi:hypothetical protein
MEPEPYNEEEYNEEENLKNIYYITNIVEDNDIDGLINMLNYSYIDLNDLQGMTSPLITLLIYRNYPEMLEIMLNYNADPNIDDGTGYTVFTRMLMTMLQTLSDIIREYRNLDKNEYIEYIYAILKLLLDNEIPIDFLKGERNNNAKNVLNRWDREYSYKSVVNIHKGIHNFKSNESDIEAKNIIKDIINEILDKKYQYDLYKIKQRLSFAKTGLPENIIDSITSNLDTDAFNQLGKSLKEKHDKRNNPYNKLQSFNRYTPEMYDEYLENKQWAEMADLYNQYGGKKKNLTFKK